MNYICVAIAFLIKHFPPTVYHDTTTSRLQYPHHGPRVLRAPATGRRQPRRPFFAFLNFLDAHAPYVLPHGRTIDSHLIS